MNGFRGSVQVSLPGGLQIVTYEGKVLVRHNSQPRKPSKLQ
jgi:hypothetical protein